MNIGIFDIHVIDVYFSSVYSNPSVFDTSSFAKNSNSKRELQNEQRLVKGEVTMCVGSGSKIDMIIIAHSLFFSGLVLNLNKCYLVFALSINMIRSCLLQYGYSFKLENNCCSVYMNKTFYGHTHQRKWFVGSRS